MNEIPLSIVLADIRADGRLELEELANSLQYELDDPARMAQSIIVRSEAELFGCSVPRFAYRVYFKGKKGFINLRRLQELTDNIRVFDVSDSKSERTLTKLPDDKREELLQYQSCIADGLIAWPTELFPQRRFHIIGARLGEAYGEEDNLPDKTGTPFVKSMDLGGGLCAQSCAFMAAASLHEFATGVHGLAEITALAHPRRAKSLRVSELNGRRLRCYFGHIRLALTVQSPFPDTQEVPHMKEKRRKEFVTALRAYVRSDMPVILPVDHCRMAGFFSLSKNAEYLENRSIYRQNGLRQIDRSKFDTTTPDRHCVVLVGCERSGNHQDTSFLFNDPNYLPFMWARAGQLADAGAYIIDKGEEIDSCVFWPVTPAAVRMPLLWHMPPIVDQFSQYFQGLKWMAEQYRLFHEISFPSGVHYFLVQIGRCSDRLFLSGKLGGIVGSEAVVKAFCDKFVEFQSEFEDRYLSSCHQWVWLEATSDRVWIWDAEMDPVVLIDEMPERLIATIDNGGGGVSITWNEN